MIDAASRLLPATAKFLRQIVPPVIATLIAAGLISAYNRAFSGHLQQPRMAALHDIAAASDAVIVGTSRPLTATAPITTYEDIAPPTRLWDKEARQDSGKDQIKAAEPPPAPVRTTATRTEPHRVAAVEPAARAPAAVTVPAPAPLIVGAPPATAPAPVASGLPTLQELRQPVLPPQPYYQPQPSYPPPVIAAQPLYPGPGSAAPPMVTVPDRARPTEATQAVPPQGTFGMIVDTLKPSNLFARARAFGEKIEQTGNDILPSIRQ